jgi:hypothetical protein
VSANCDDEGAFDPPVYFASADGVPALDAIPPWHDQGQDVFTGQQLGCELGSSCFSEFDEDLRRTVPQRPTPASSVLATGEEYRVELGGLSELEIVTALGTYSTGLTGQVGFSNCRDGNATSPCGFYLGALTAATTGSVAVSMECDDETTQMVTIDSVGEAEGLSGWSEGWQVAAPRARSSSPTSVTDEEGAPVQRLCQQPQSGRFPGNPGTHCLH